MTNAQAIANIAPAIKYYPDPKRYYFDVTLGSVLLSGEDTGAAYSLVELRVAPGKGIARHIHTREEEAYFVLSGELEATIGDDVFILKAGETLIAPRDIPHALRNPGKVANHYLTLFSPSGFEGFLEAISVAASDGAVAPTQPPPSPIQNVFELAASYGIQFDPAPR
jgi:mannose-6-phosphate isomerase-like protein (cupin superfamily)